MGKNILKETSGVKKKKKRLFHAAVSDWVSKVIFEIKLGMRKYEKVILLL